MLFAYRSTGAGLSRVITENPSLAEPTLAFDLPADAVWVDLYRPLSGQVAAVGGLGIHVPTLSEMEEIEISSRLYHEDGADYLTVVLPGRDPDGHVIAGPVTFVLQPSRLITVRHHLPRAFETYPLRAGQGPAGCATPDRIFLGLMAEIVGSLADSLEEAGRVLDEAGRRVFSGHAANRPDLLQKTLEEVGLQGERLSRVRTATTTLDRALNHFAAARDGQGLKALVKAELRDLAALAVHADFLAARVGLAVDATLGMIHLAQNATVRIVSVVAVLFLPPTLVASAYGMNFATMPGLNRGWGYPAVLGLMLASALGTYLFFKWKHWL